MRQVNKFKKLKIIIGLILSLSTIFLSTYRCMLRDEQNKLDKTIRIIFDSHGQLLESIIRFKNNPNINTPLDPVLKEKIEKILENPDSSMEEVFQNVKY